MVAGVETCGFMFNIRTTVTNRGRHLDGMVVFCNRSNTFRTNFTNSWINVPALEHTCVESELSSLLLTLGLLIVPASHSRGLETGKVVSKLLT